MPSQPTAGGWGQAPPTLCPSWQVQGAAEGTRQPCGFLSSWVPALPDCFLFYRPQFFHEKNGGGSGGSVDLGGETWKSNPTQPLFNPE